MIHRGHTSLWSLWPLILVFVAIIIMIFIAKYHKEKACLEYGEAIDKEVKILNGMCYHEAYKDFWVHVRKK